MHFKNHPFKVEKDQALFELRQSIESEGNFGSSIGKEKVVTEPDMKLFPGIEEKKLHYGLVWSVYQLL